MIKETLFTNNKSQAVRIPKALEFPESDLPAGLTMDPQAHSVETTGSLAEGGE